ncbi:YraN family protein [Hoyosella rhizosphaerae]|uniref:UPF0102 protein GCM10011410_11730 n=1 Tax=Hoyosella rhizosphaerae TaxID=1755582 RepID=A0A916XB60_9ACTN|nr:YraN family protein [Hoyosella rhizosphaerae]MBN4926248.1 YraN family protein [Hoyosella rhizosphaerae]GGC60902.1 UPF0102 protein [Hoyosella rhizosphaerae]
MPPLHSRPPTLANQQITLGRKGEDIAANYLVQRGFTLLDRNWRCRYGELDLVCAADSDTLVFVEVKTRSTLTCGHPCESVSSRKLERMRHLARLWLSQHSRSWRTVRFDIVGIIVDAAVDLEAVAGADVPTITHLENVI